MSLPRGGGYLETNASGVRLRSIAAGGREAVLIQLLREGDGERTATQ